MKSVPYLPVVIALFVMLAGCGQKGPLYMPAPAPIATPAPQTAPADSNTPASK